MSGNPSDRIAVRRTGFRRLVVLVIVAVIGICSRAWPVGTYFWDKSVGDLCYAAGAFLVTGLLARRKRPMMIAVIAMAYCLAIECFKLTGLPARWDGNWVLRVVFGTTFSVENIVCYAVAIGVMWAMEKNR
jgi:hypothetical protein